LTVTRPEFIALTVGLALALFPALSNAAGEDDLKRQLVAAAQRSQDNEERVSRIEARLLEMSRQEAELSAALLGRRAAQTAALGALMRISRQPPQALIATPTAIDDTIRTSLLLGSTASRLGAEARDLGADRLAGRFFIGDEDQARGHRYPRGCSVALWRFCGRSRPDRLK